MSKPRELYVKVGYDDARQAYIIKYYEYGRYVCTYTAYLNHRTRTFKCYPRELALHEPPRGIMYLPESQVQSERQQNS